MSSPNNIDDRMSMLLTNPSVEKDSRISIVDRINPEFLITL